MTTPAYALNPDEVQIGTANGPGIYLAPVGTTPPANTTEDWPAGWEILGYLSDDGPTVGQSIDTESLTPWQSITPIRTVITGRAVTLQFVLWQINAATIALYFDADPVTPAADGSLSIDIRSDTKQHQYAVGIDAADGDRVMRVIFGIATLSDAGDMQIQRGAAVPLDCTLTALDNAGKLATILVGPSATAPAGNTVTVTSPGAQTSPIDTAITAVQITATTSGAGTGATITNYSAVGLPVGLTIDAATGAITGTPTAAGTANVTVTARDSTNASGSVQFTWTTTAAAATANVVTVTNPGAQNSAVGTPIAGLQVAATDSAAGETLTYAATGLPAGLAINAATGAITGTPAGPAGTANVTVTVTDTTNASGTAQFTWVTA